MLREFSWERRGGRCRQGRRRASKDVLLVSIGFSSNPWGDLEQELYHRLVFILG